MKLKVAAFVAALFLVAMAIDPSTQAAILKSNPAGQELAVELRNARPEENSEISGVLKIHSSTNRGQIPVRAKVTVEDGKWKSIYTTSPANNSVAFQIVVIHSSNAPNQYLYARATDEKSSLPEPKALPNKAAAETSLAGSDFTVADLGLDFLHWPEQNLVNSDMRLGRDCYVLESRNPEAKEMVRVKSWIDKESNGVLIAEGYDAKDEKVKVFSLSGSSFKKIKGQWQLEKMTIRSPKKDSETVLQFDLPK